MSRYTALIDGEDGAYGVAFPDLPGCVATGKTREEVERNMHQAVEMHVQGLLEDKLPIPESTAYAEYVVVPA